MSAFLGVLFLCFAVALLVPFVIYLVVPLIRGIVWLIAHIAKFVMGMIGDTLRLVGASLTGILIIPMTVGAVALGRWSTSAHFGRALKGEVVTVGRCFYRIAIGHPARLLGLTPLTEGVERRIPEVIAAAPGRDTPTKRTGQFDGYTIVGSLPGGGSGAKLYVADPSDTKRAALERQFDTPVDKVVIKTFSTRDGSSLPQIVRESRSLDAAKRMGLILEHDLSPDRFFYVMRYVPGESLGVITQRLHGMGDNEGLAPRELGQALHYGCDLVDTLRRYHEGGLWHKDVKPDNIIIDSTGAHLVDFGLITPLRSALTLTTHGTEYFRDPEMVRMALRGAKVHEVDGTKFDVYAAGAVLYSLVENSFPAHGGLSQISKRCPESLRWVIRRAMTEYDKRYESANAMLDDLRAIVHAQDPFTLRPAELPSMGGQPAPEPTPQTQAQVAPPPIPQAIPAPAPNPGAAPTPPARRNPNLQVTSWFSGRYQENDGGPARPAPAARRTPAPRVVQAAHARSNVPRHPNAPAAEQVANARQRARERRDRARNRVDAKRSGNHASGLNFGVGLAVLSVIGLVVTGALLAIINSQQIHRAMTSAPSTPDTPRGWTRDVVWNNGLSRHVFDNWGGYQLVFAPAPERVSHVHGDHGTEATGVIVLADPIADEPNVRARADAHISTLRERGLHVVTNNGGDHAQQLIASLRLALQLEPIGSQDANEIIRDWLSQHPEFGLALWIGRSDEPDTPAHLVVGANGLDELVYAAALSAFSSTGTTPGMPELPGMLEMPETPDMPDMPDVPGHGSIHVSDTADQTVRVVHRVEQNCNWNVDVCDEAIEATCTASCTNR